MVTGPRFALPLVLILLTSACGEDVAPVPEQPEEEPPPQSVCPLRSVEFEDVPLRLTCADAPELCAEATWVHRGTSPLGVVDLLFIPEGYTEAQLPSFREDVDFHVQALLAREPFASYKERLSFRRLDLVSATDDMFNQDLTDTALGACGHLRRGRFSYDFQRLRLAASGRATVAIVLVNHTNVPITVAPLTSPGGLAYVFQTRDQGPTVLAHELGHSLFFLGDEYGNRVLDTCMPPQQPVFSTAETEFFPNLTFEPTGARWAHIAQGAEPSGFGYPCGVYNPPGQCMMGQDVNQPLCAVCRAHVDALFAGFAGVDDGPPRCELTLDQPPSELKGTAYVGGRNTDYNGVRSWEVRLDETLLGAGSQRRTGFRGGVLDGPFAALDTTRFPNGPHTLRLRCTDTLGNTSEKAVEVRIANRVTRPPSP